MKPSSHSQLSRNINNNNHHMYLYNTTQALPSTTIPTRMQNRNDYYCNKNNNLTSSFK